MNAGGKDNCTIDTGLSDVDYLVATATGKIEEKDGVVSAFVIQKNPANNNVFHSYIVFNINSYSWTLLSYGSGEISGGEVTLTTDSKVFNSYRWEAVGKK